MPSSLQAQMTRRAISPRLAIRIFLNMQYDLACDRLQRGGKFSPAGYFRWPDGEQLLAVFDGLAVVDQDLDDLAGDIGFDLVHQLHRFDDAEHLADFDLVAGLDEGRRTGDGDS